MRSRKTWREKEHPIQSEKFKDRIIFMSAFNDIEWKQNDENCISIAEKVKNYAFHKDIQHSWNRFYAQKENWNSAADEMVPRFKETCYSYFPTYQCIETRNLEAEEKKKNILHFNGHLMNTELLFQTIHFLNQLSIQFGLTEEEQGRVKFCGQQDVNKITTGKNTTVDIFSHNSIWKQNAQERFELRSADRQRNSSHKFAKKLTSNIMLQSGKKVQNST